jgi:hypothetical protein
MTDPQPTLDFQDPATQAAAFAIYKPGAPSLADGVQPEHVMAVVSYLCTDGQPMTPTRTAHIAMAYAMLLRAAAEFQS